MKNKTKTLWIVLSIALLLTVSVGGTLAYLNTQSDDVENTFTPSYVKCQVIEDEFDGKIKKNVKIQNTGNIDAYIRAAVVVTWKSALDGSVYGQAPKATDYEITFNNADWNQKGEFWYYDTEVEPNDFTPELIKSCSLTENAEVPAGYYLNVEILAQAIQKDGIGADSAQAAFAAAKAGN